MPQPKKPAPAKRASTTKRSSTTKKRPTAAKRTNSSAPRTGATTANRASATPQAASADALSRLTGLRDMLTKSVMLTGDRIQEVVDDAVSRGRLTRTDAEDLVQRLISLGRQQTEDIIGDLEQLLGRGTSTSGDRVLQQVDKARRAVGIGTFPILGYDDLSAGQVVDRLGDLTPAQLRKVRDHEKRNANRKSILQAIERKLK
jgi:polyhydroxyalkanoate synthesis regulator phasin